jgi:hypothetical protein
MSGETLPPGLKTFSYVVWNIPGRVGLHGIFHCADKSRMMSLLPFGCQTTVKWKRVDAAYTSDTDAVAVYQRGGSQGRFVSFFGLPQIPNVWRL